jgi:hypothetical protein
MSVYDPQVPRAEASGGTQVPPYQAFGPIDGGADLRVHPGQRRAHAKL